MAGGEEAHTSIPPQLGSNNNSKINDVALHASPNTITYKDGLEWIALMLHRSHNGYP